MRFLDANIFIYAYYKPKKTITNISQGKEEVLTTIIHISEIVNILKHGLSTGELNKLILGLFMLDNLQIHGVTREQYLAATELADELKLECNDALAIDITKQNNVTEIYTFDEDFNNIQGIAKLPKP